MLDRTLSHLSNYAAALQSVQKELEAACKSFQSLKQGRENLNRLSMTTVVESIVNYLYKVDRSFDIEGKHLVEERFGVTNRGKPDEKSDKKDSKHQDSQGNNSPNLLNSSNYSPLKVLDSYLGNNPGKGHKGMEKSDQPEARSGPALAKDGVSRKKGVSDASHHERTGDSVIEAIKMKK